MKDQFWYSPYQSKPVSSSSRVHQGFLICWRSEDFSEGYADCHPLDIFGDDTMEVQLKKWRQGQPTTLLQKSLYFARLDGIARSLQKSLFKDGPQKIKSHFTVVDLLSLDFSQPEVLLNKGFTTLKIKVGRQVDEEVNVLKKQFSFFKEFRWRLDFNGCGFESFMQKAGNLRDQIDFVEDPCPYSFELWEELSQKWHMDIYFDQPTQSVVEGSVPFPRVIKPARQNLEWRSNDIITNSMDHAVGQSFAFWSAQQELIDRPQTKDFGLQTNHLFEQDSFAQEIFSDDCYFRPSEGWGIGFNDQFKKLTWMPL